MKQVEVACFKRDAIWLQLELQLNLESEPLVISISHCSKVKRISKSFVATVIFHCQIMTRIL